MGSVRWRAPLSICALLRSDLRTAGDEQDSMEPGHAGAHKPSQLVLLREGPKLVGGVDLRLDIKMSCEQVWQREMPLPDGVFVQAAAKRLRLCPVRRERGRG